MGQRHLVRGETSGWFTASRFLGPLGILAGIVLLPLVPPAGIIVGAIGVLVTIFVELFAFWTRMQRVWVEVHDTGFAVIDSRGERQHRDDEVHSIAYSVKNQYNNGEFSGVERKCSLWILGQPAPLQMENKFKKDQSDPLAGLIDRLIDLLHDGFNAALEAGHAIQGDGWRLTKHELAFRRGSQEDSLRLEEIAAVESREGKMGVWRKGADEPHVQFPVDGRNIWLLRMLVMPRLKEDEQASEPPKEGLGRILFQRRPGAAAIYGLFGAGIIAPIVGIGLIVAGTEMAMFIVGSVLLLAGPLLLVAGYACKKSNFRVHEWGVYQAGLTGEQRLMYLDVASFSYGATRHYHNGVYTGTQLSLRFDPMPGAKSTAITYSTQVQGDDADLDELRDFVSGVIARRMGNELANGGVVPWTKNMRFTPQGIEYTPSGFFGKKQTAFLPHEQYGGWNMDQGVFYLFQRDVPKSVMSEQVSEANFYPGFFLLLQLYHQEPETSEAAAQG